MSLIIVGDISFSRGVEEIIKRMEDINYPFLKVKDYIKNSDLAFGNLETPIIEGEQIPNFQMIFRSNPGVENSLKEPVSLLFHWPIITHLILERRV